MPQPTRPLSPMISFAACISLLTVVCNAPFQKGKQFISPNKLIDLYVQSLSNLQLRLPGLFKYISMPFCYHQHYIKGLKTPPGEYSTGFHFTYIRESLIKQLLCKFWPSSQKMICNRRFSAQLQACFLAPSKYTFG